MSAPHSETYSNDYAEGLAEKTYFRLAFGVEYNGRGFCGWQYQPQKSQVRSVQAVIYQSLLKLLAEKELPNNPPLITYKHIVAAGRTDTGVHAKEQVIHIDLPIKYLSRDDNSWVRGFNNFLPQDVCILWCKKVAQSFSARKSAISREYRYLLKIAPQKPAILEGLIGWHYQKLNINDMQIAAQFLVGKHDFSSFRDSQCQALSPIREVYLINIYKNPEFDVIVFEIKANAFLHHMVRNIVGTLIKVGSGEKPIEWLQTLLSARDRTQAGANFMPDGLYLWKVSYE